MQTPGSPSGSVDPITNPRKRASSIVPELPCPEDRPQKYTLIRAQRGIDYAKHRMASTKRRPSPNEKLLLSVYQSVCEGLREVLESSESDRAIIERHAIQVRNYEKHLSDYGWVRACESDAEQEFQDQLLALRRTAYYARYGDYAKLEVHRLRLGAAATDQRAFEELNGKKYWSEIAERIAEEAPEWNRTRSAPSAKAKTTSAIWRVCENTGMDFKRTLQVVQFYGERNKTMHNNLEDLIKAKKWNDLALILYTDFIDIPSVLPANWVNEKEFMKAFLLEKIQRWYIWKTDDFHNPQTWIYTTQLEEDGAAISKTPKKAIEDIDVIVTDLARRTMKQQELHRHAVALAQNEDTATFPEAGPVLTPKKRKHFEFETKEEAIAVLKRQRSGVRDAVKRQDQAAKDLSIAKNELSTAKNDFSTSVGYVIQKGSDFNEFLLYSQEKFPGLTDHEML